MVVVSGNTGLAQLIGSKIIRDRVSVGSIWSEKGAFGLLIIHFEWVV